MRNELMASGPYMQRGNCERKEIKCFLSTCMGNEMIARQFCTNLMGALTACFAGNIVVSRDKEFAQKQYLQCRAQIIPSLWNDAHKALGLPQPDPLWTQTVSKLCFDAICKVKTMKSSSLPEVMTPVPLPADAENVIRYVAGYIPFKLLHRYKKMDSEDACAYIEILESLSKIDSTLSTSPSSVACSGIHWVCTCACCIAAAASDV